MTDPQPPELRPAYRTLNEPTRLLGLSLAGWVAVLVAGAASYGWLSISPLPWRANVSMAAIALGLPTAMVVLREQSTITPARLLAGVLRWRALSPLLLAPGQQRPVRRGAVRLDSAGQDQPAVPSGDLVDLPWVDREPEPRA